MEFDLADHIRRTREGLGWTQTELARRAQIDQGDLSRIERGATDPRWSTVKKLSAALGEAIVIDSPSTRPRELSDASRARVRDAAARTSLAKERRPGEPLAVKR